MLSPTQAILSDVGCSVGLLEYAEIEHRANVVTIMEMNLLLLIMFPIYLSAITVEPPIAGRPPYRSLRAVFPHKAPRFKLSLLPHQCGSIKLQTVSYLASLLCKDTALYTAPTYR